MSFIKLIPVPHRTFARLVSNKSCFVYISKTTDPYENLAFEHWMYEKVNFRENDCLFLWRNEPSVVIGRHQNPWKECNVSALVKDGINICRRNSGGGAVYHDLGNVNFTFFTERKSYHRKHNLEVILHGLKHKWPLLDLSINKRDDIILNKKFKISGSSSKLGQRSAYHHCTLLINSNKENIVKSLFHESLNINCNATASVRSLVLNLNDVEKSICFESVCDAVSSVYCQSYSASNLFYINSNDENLTPGVKKFLCEYKNWDWVYGKTPDFFVESHCRENKFGIKLLTVFIKKGRIYDIKLELEELSDHNDLINVTSYLIGSKFVKDVIKSKLSHNNVRLKDKSFFRYICYEIIGML